MIGPPHTAVARRLYFESRLALHNAKLRARGHDPKWIGIQEVRPVCCPNCKCPIPWEIIKGT